MATARADRQRQRQAVTRAQRRALNRPSPADRNVWLPRDASGLGPPERIPPVNADVRQAFKRGPIADSIDSALGPGQVEREMVPGPHVSNIGDIGPIPNPRSNRTNREFVRQVSGSGRMRADDPSTW